MREVSCTRVQSRPAGRPRREPTQMDPNARVRARLNAPVMYKGVYGVFMGCLEVFRGVKRWIYGVHICITGVYRCIYGNNGV